jgi:hypothetical protein
MKKGYVIANQNEEFVHEIQTAPGYLKTGWSKKPDFAKVFETRSKCRKAIKLLQSPKYKLWELGILETENQYILSCQSTERPPWFSINTE